jgi:hypothetical protein
MIKNEFCYTILDKNSDKETPMSKFIEILQQDAKSKPARMGFGVESASVKSRIHLVVEMSDINTNALSKYIDDIDAGLLSIDNVNSAFETIKKLDGSSRIPWGLIIRDQVKDGLLKSPADFIIFPSTIPFFAKPKELGIIIEIDFNIPDSSLRAIEELPVDALFINENPGIFNWQFLVNLQRIDNIFSKSILMRIQNNLSVTEIEMLWQVGVDALVLQADGASNKINQVRQAINSGNYPIPRKLKKVDVTLPFASPISPVPDEDEEEEEQETL